MEKLITALALSKPKTAAEVLTKHPEMANSKMYSTLAFYWAGRRPLDAEKWVRQLPEGEAKTKTLSSLVGGMTQSDPEAGAIRRLWNWHVKSQMGQLMIVQ